MSKYETLAREMRAVLEDEDVDNVNTRFSDSPCWHQQEALQFLSEDTGIGYDTLCEAMKCDHDCMSQYRTKKGDFKGGKGTAFDNCVKATTACCSGVDDPEAFCAYLGRRAGKI